MALSVYRAVFAVTFDPARCLSLFLSYATSPLSSQPFLSVVHPSSLRDVRLRCANDRAADIGNYSLRNLRAPSLLLLLLLLFLFLPVLSSPIVLACPSHLLLFLDALSFVLVPRWADTKCIRNRLRIVRRLSLSTLTI